MQGTEFLIVLGSGAFLLGLATIIWISQTKRLGYGTPNWPAVPGRVISVGVSELTRETSDGMVSSFTPIVTYEYELDGVAYRSERLNALSDVHRTFANRPSAASVIVAYAPETPVDVYYNPANPKQALLNPPKPIAHNAVQSFGVTSLIIGALIIALGILLL